MLRTRFIKIVTARLNDGRFFLSAENSEGNPLWLSRWKNLLFSGHEESYFGTFLDRVERDNREGVIVDAWQLVTLFARESFNTFIEWEWSEDAEMYFAAAPALHEAIVEQDWLPDFTALEDGEFRWQLPERVKSEFGEGFWEQEMEDSTAAEVVPSWFSDALDAYLTNNKEMKESFGRKLELLKEQNLSGAALSDFFNEESWLEWVGVKDNDLPFTIALRLVEPEDGEGDWMLDVALRGKKDTDALYSFDDPGIPKAWREHLDRVAVEAGRWVKLIPWLEGDDAKLKTALSEEEAWLFLTEASETLLALGVEILLPSWWQAIKNANLKVKASLKGTSSHRPSFVGLQAMLDFNWRFSMNGVDLSEDDFNALVNEKRRLVFVRGKWVKLDPSFIKQIQELMVQAEREGLQIRDLLEQELNPRADDDVDELDNPKVFAKIQIELNRQWKQMIKQLSEIKELPLRPVPASLQGELRPYQQLGMSWMLFLRDYHFGAVLADDMGLGKTVQLISYLLSVKEQAGADHGPALIICPTSVLGNWQKELERFSPSLNVYLHYGSGRLKEEAFLEKATSVDVVLTSYGLSHLDEAEFAGLTWSSIAIDEAQNIKNAGTKQSRAVRRLKGLHQIALTGTPMENRLSELWSIFDFTNHGYLGSMGQFQKRFVIPIEKEEKTEKVQELQGLIRPFLMRRTKRDEEVALNLPDKLEQKEYCPLTAEQASLYEQLVRDTFAEIEKLSGFERKGLILQMLSKLKQLCNHPALYLKERDLAQHLEERSTKLEKLTELVESLLENGESCLIFTQYLDMGDMIKKLLGEKFGITVPFLNGSVPKAQRDDMIEKFQNREFPVFLLSLKAGGTGLNLTAANHVIHYDRWWNPAVENQATDRAHRIGQQRFVHVHKLICTGTLEEKIDLMLEKKQNLNDQIIQSENWITELSTDDLRELVDLTRV